jgi:hypothetical protein
MYPDNLINYVKECIMAYITSDQLARQFIDRGLTTAHGKLLTTKQAKFLFDLARQEAERAKYFGPFRAVNGAPQIGGMGWTLYINRNGSGALKEE